MKKFTLYSSCIILALAMITFAPSGCGQNSPPLGIEYTVINTSHGTVIVGSAALNQGFDDYYYAVDVSDAYSHLSDYQFIGFQVNVIVPYNTLVKIVREY